MELIHQIIVLNKTNNFTESYLRCIKQIVLFKLHKQLKKLAFYKSI
jgi:hypothetical protein